MPNRDYRVIDYPAVREFTADVGRINRDRHYVRAFLEADVTFALHKLKILRAPGKKISFLAWFIKVLADCVAQHPPINGIRAGRKRIIVFRNVDVSTIVEKVVENQPVPLPLVLRSANTKTPFELNEEIQSAVAQTPCDAGSLVLGQGQNPLLMKLALSMPSFLRLFIMRAFILNHPQRMQNLMGTVIVTSLGTVGGMSGWIMPTSMHPLSIGIGTLNKKPAIFQGSIQKRDILHLTIAFDHNIIDGMPARAFVNELLSKLETGSGLS